MKRIFSIIVLLVFMAHGLAQNYFFNTPQGFGAAATGGGNATPITVYNYTDLKTNMTTSGSKVILVSGQITIPSSQPISAVISNKTIIGLPGAKLINETQSNPGAGIFYLKPGSNNIIIRNLIFVGPAAYDIDGQDNMTSDGCTNLWVDHCEFQDGQDGNFDIKGLSDNVTVSWCKFTYLKAAVPGGSGGTNDHRFSDLVGSSSTDAPADGHYSITFQNNYWATGCKERMPRARNGELHILNCYYNVGVTGSLAIGLGGGINNTTCYVENTNFANITQVYRNYNSTDGGTVNLNFSNCLNGVANVGSVTPPSYSTSVMPVNEVADRLSDSGCGAGATLHVSNSGVITPGNCTNLATTNIVQKSEILVYPSPAKNVLNFTSKKESILDIEIHSIEGKIISQNPVKPFIEGNYPLNIESLKPGVYFYLVKTKSTQFKGKFIKE